MVAAAYGELADEQMHELDRHLRGCEECRVEREAVWSLKSVADAYPVQEPDANLVARSRMRLATAHDEIPAQPWYQRLSQRLLYSFATLGAVPLAASLLLIAGVAAGSVGGYEVAVSRAHQDALNEKIMAAKAVAVPASAGQTEPAGQGEIASVSSVAHQGSDGLVDVSYNQLVPRHIQGSVNDPAIRRLLMVAAQKAASAGVRDNSVALLADECRSGHGCQATEMRDALMRALRSDRNPRVREKALHGLEPYIAQDMEVRDAVLETLLNDPSPRVRTAALNLVEPDEADTSVRQVLHSVANSDQNPYIRTVSRQVLNQVPEIQ